MKKRRTDSTVVQRGASPVASGAMVRALCLKAIRDYRAYQNIPFDAHLIWAESERKGAALLARRVLRVLQRPNGGGQT